nr:pyridoxamine 5'-phosphate oxidase family protein [Streptomyces phaeochromogenes]
MTPPPTWWPTLAAWAPTSRCCGPTAPSASQRPARGRHDGRRVTAFSPERAGLDRDEALKLLAQAPLGRVVFSHRALLAIRPVNHLVEEGGDTVIRIRTGAALPVGGRRLRGRQHGIGFPADSATPTARRRQASAAEPG